MAKVLLRLSGIPAAGLNGWHPRALSRHFHEEPICRRPSISGPHIFPPSSPNDPPLSVFHTPTSEVRAARPGGSERLALDRSRSSSSQIVMPPAQEPLQPSREEPRHCSAARPREQVGCQVTPPGAEREEKGCSRKMSRRRGGAKGKTGTGNGNLSDAQGR